MLRSTLLVIPVLLVAACGDDEAPSGDKTSQGGSAGASGSGGSGGRNTGGSSGTGMSGGRNGGGTSGAEGGGGTSGTGGGGTSGSSGTGGSGGTGGGGGGVVGTACTQFFDGSATLDAIESAINSAAPGAVICLARGASWAGSLSIDNGNATASDRVIVCASDADDECSAGGGAANPRLDGQGRGISFDAGSEGFVLANIDVVCASGCDGAVGVDFAGASHIRIEGGRVADWGGQGFMCNSFTDQTTPCDDIEIGLAGNLTELSGNENGFYGWLSNSFIRINAHDNGDGTVFMHHWYLSSGPQNSPSRNVVFENGIYTRSSVEGGRSYGTFLNFSGQNQDLVIRNNVFDEPACGTYFIDCGSGGEDPEEYCDGVQIYENTFKGDCPVVINLQGTQRARIFNNLIIGNGQTVVLADLERPASDGWFFNNTVYCPANCETSLVLQGNNHRAFNNVFHHEPGGGEIVEGGNGACARFGANGVNFNNNFLYAPDDSPRLPNCGSGNSTTFATEPGFVDEAGEDFHITSSSAVAGFGTSENAPETDFDGATRPSPPSAGAFDVP